MTLGMAGPLRNARDTVRCADRYVAMGWWWNLPIRSVDIIIKKNNNTSGYNDAIIRNNVMRIHLKNSKNKRFHYNPTRWLNESDLSQNLDKIRLVWTMNFATLEQQCNKFKLVQVCTGTIAMTTNRISNTSTLLRFLDKLV